MTEAWPPAPTPAAPATGDPNAPAVPGPEHHRHRERARLGVGGAIAIGLATLLTIGADAGIAWAALHPQQVIDQIRVWQYDPTPTIATYAARSTLTDEGRFLFYTSRPSVDPKDDFNRICSSQQEDVGILGCYLPDDKTIHLYDVTDDRLDGLEEVVASHEMLHAAWDRLDDAERERLSVLLEAEVTARADDADLQATLEFYAAAEPGERANELHSIVGTEFADISDELETYYARYFTNRAALIALHEKSNAVFVEQAAAIDDLVGQLEALQASIESDYAAYNAGYDALNADIASFNARAESGDFSSQAQFDRERNALLARQSDLDNLYASIDARATQYDELLAELDQLNAEVDELNQSINIAPRDDGL